MASFCISLFSTQNTSRAVVSPLHPADAPSGAPGYHPAAVNPYRDELTFDFRTMDDWKMIIRDSSADGVVDQRTIEVIFQPWLKS